MNEIERLQNEAIANDLWIAAIPDDKYAPCPCGCGKKMKFILDNPEPHEKAFKEDFMIGYAAYIGIVKDAKL